MDLTTRNQFVENRVSKGNDGQTRMKTRRQLDERRQTEDRDYDVINNYFLLTGQDTSTPSSLGSPAWRRPTTNDVSR